jgi:hypothetical protein
MAIAAVFLVASYMAYTVQIGKGRDAKRREDLHRIRNAFEEYYNDNGCFPSGDILADCGSENLSPYLSEIPCDPETKEPYFILVDDDSACPSWYIVLTEMEHLPGLDNPCQTGCNFEGNPNTYYYYISSGNILPWKTESFIGFGEQTGEDCNIYDSGIAPGCFIIDISGNCNTATGLGCGPGENCFLDENCSVGCETESCD